MWVELRKTGLMVTRGAQVHRQSVNPTPFKASAGWCTRFMRRKNLTLRQRTHIAQKLPKDVDDKLYQFLKFVIDERKSSTICSTLGTWTRPQCTSTCLDLKPWLSKVSILYMSRLQATRSYCRLDLQCQWWKVEANYCLQEDHHVKRKVSTRRHHQIQQKRVDEWGDSSRVDWRGM